MWIIESKRRLLVVLVIAFGAVLLFAGGVVAWQVQATYAGARAGYAALAARIDPVERRLADGQDPEPADIERLARDRETRRVLYNALEVHDRLDLFPAQYRTREAMGEADMVLWLGHPHELGATPDEIELTRVVAAPGAPRGSYCLFRFRMKPPHWAAHAGWLAGVAGPYVEDEEVLVAAAGTFSRFEPYDSRTPEDHVRAAHALVAGGP